MKILMVVNEDRFFLSHRKPVALAAKDKGYEMVIVAKNTGSRQEIEQLGFRFIDLPINPTGMNPVQECRTLRFLLDLYRKELPDIVHHVGLKNILWGGIAAKRAKIKGVVNAVSGLGGLFNGDKYSLTTKGILWLMGYANNRDGIKVIFQNKDDMDIFLSHYVVKPLQIEFTNGSGIDLQEYGYTLPQKEGKVKIIFTARMVREKGVCDLISAAEKLKPQYKDKIQVLLCGRLTPNKSGVTEEYMKVHCDGEYICWLGERNDIKILLERSDIMAFPSYYREGVPKSLIEASAIGRPIVTCDSTGCRDVVDDGVNGFLIHPQNSYELAQKLSILIDNESLRLKMGKASRKKAEQLFSITNVVDTHLRIYDELIKS
ncbi:MAG: glycosyltransferase family 4 protein [Muribaculaceae bacterium]|nr:glycosyltransferase family 4 protein [Muribaculaceae bacterium]